MGADEQIYALLCKVAPSQRKRFAREHLKTIAPNASDIVARFSDGKRNRILFVSLHSTPRESRLARCAIKAGRSVILLAKSQPLYSTNECYEGILVSQALSVIILVSWLFPGNFIHVFGWRGDDAYRFCKVSGTPYILDIYDTCFGMKNSADDQLAAERWSIENAAAIVHRDLRIRALAPRAKTLNGQHNLFLPDPVAIKPQISRKVKQPQDIRIASIGWIDERGSSILSIARTLVSHGVSVHVFSNPPIALRPKGEIESYLHLAQSSSLFHIEDEIPAQKVVEVLQNFDFGLAAFDQLVDSHENEDRSSLYLKSCGSSRVLDYIAAGIPILGNQALKFQRFLARRFGAGYVEVDRGFMADPVKCLLDPQMPIGDPKKCPFSIERSSLRLNALYSSLEKKAPVKY